MTLLKTSYYLQNKIYKRSVILARDRCQNLLQILSEFKRINQLLLTLKSSENIWFSVHFRGDTSKIIRLNLLNIRIETWLQSLK